MSANNQLVIIKGYGRFEVHENPCVDNQFVPNKETLLFTVDTLEEAVRKAKEYIQENIVEYGLDVML